MLYLSLLEGYITTPKNTSKRGNRRVRQNKRSGMTRTMEVRDPIQSSEFSLASRGDKISVRGKVLLNNTLPTSLTAIPLLPAVFGSRALALSLLFARWRIEKLLLKIGNTYYASFYLPYGIMDDFSGEGGSVPIPVNNNDILELRSSTVVMNNGTIMKWNPVDPSKWYYTTQGGTGSDSRFVIPASLFLPAAPSGTIPTTIELHWTLSFEGAVDVGSS